MDSRDRRNGRDFFTGEQVRRVLAASGIEVSQELDSDYLIFCPFHNNHRTPAAEVNKETGILFCFACHVTSTLIETVMHQTGRSYFEAARLIKSKESQSNLTDDIEKRLIAEPEYKEFDQDVVDRLSLQALSSTVATDYFSSRKITQESMQKFKLGYSEKQEMVTVPVHSPSGILVGFVGRSVEGKVFKNTPGLPKAKTLFNIHRVKSENTTYVVESSFDAIRLDQCGISAVATLGANVSNKQVELLKKYFNNIVIVADNDIAGGNMKNKILESLGSRVSVVQLDQQYKDIGDMEDKDIKLLSPSFDNSIMSMLK